ncbi:MAG TPA: tRNA (adenosine(37)-N6)-threonylcarbamoyltransferase complex ATPase subunit type 1 TsaE [Nitrospiraceae bacterium]|nr:tRNA (adenosine(37)-N6)-threonylcarbamoyltransferase complex ATPase subunit type 1 TsaE [Nitrospiraceae bacterium]
MAGSRKPQLWECESHSVADTEALGQRIGQLLHGGEILALQGELGAGKTALIRGIATGLDIPPRTVSSPTFVLVHRYRGRLVLVHADLYRLEAHTEFPQLGIDEDFDGRTVVAIEWAEKAERDLPSDRMEVHLSHISRSRRRIRFQPTGPRSRRLLNRLMATQAGPPRRGHRSPSRHVGRL